MNAPYYPGVHDRPVIGIEDHDPEYLTKYDAVTEKIFESIKLIATYDCRRKDHAVDQLCSCPRALKHVTIKKRKFLIYISFVVEWEQHILSSDAALRFINNQAGKDAFLTSQGISAEDFARAFADATFTSPTMIAPASDMDEVVGSMLGFWDHRVTSWREQDGSNTAIRAMRKACMPSDPEFARAYPNMTVADPSYPPQLGKNLVFKRMRFGRQESSHRHTVYLMPLQPKLMPDGRWDINLKIMGVKPCHESCTLNPALFTQRLFGQLMRFWLNSEGATTEVIERQAGESNEEFEKRRLAFRAAREP